MPELPEVETMCRGIAPIVGLRVVRAERPPCACRPISIRPRLDFFRRRTEGKSVVAVERLGKRVVIWLGAKPGDKEGLRIAREEAIVIEPRMTGLVLLAAPPTQQHLRMRLHLSGDSKRDLLFWDRRGLGNVRLFSAAEFAAEFQGKNNRLGPDALLLSVEEVRLRLCRSRRAIKVALLDQRAMAGVGNLYASEILHAAGIHPAARCHRLKRGDWNRLHAATHEILESAIRYEGSTLGDGTYRNALNQSGGYQHHHRVYDCAGRNCPTCGRGSIRRIVQAQRSTYFCPACQKR